MISKKELFWAQKLGKGFHNLQSEFHELEDCYTELIYSIISCNIFSLLALWGARNGLTNWEPKKAPTLEDLAPLWSSPLSKRINVGPGKFSKKNTQNVQTYVKKIKLENVRSPWKKFQNWIHLPPLLIVYNQNQVSLSGTKTKVQFRAEILFFWNRNFFF